MAVVLRCVGGDGEHEIVVNKSRFVCAVAPVGDEEAARGFIAARRKRFHDASHHCSAYVLGVGGRVARSSDDGEPAGTAGVPMLAVLRQRELTDTVAVVTRYFGGVKLGAGGLVRAYGAAVASAIDAVGVVARQVVSVVTVTAEYGLAGRLEAELRASRFPVLDISFGEVVGIEVAVAEVGEFTDWLSARTAGAVRAEVTGSTVVESPDGS